MSYCRWSDGDCYVYNDVNDRKGEIRCCSCSLRFVSVPKGGVFESPYPTFIARGAQEMIDHLKEHQAVGHSVPSYAFTRLQEEAKERKKKPVKYLVHALTNKMENKQGEVIDFAPMPLCGYSSNSYYRKLLKIKKSEEGHAHPRDETTLDTKKVTCPECKSRMKKGHTAAFQKDPT